VQKQRRQLRSDAQVDAWAWWEETLSELGSSGADEEEGEEGGGK
jgi:hypothetical protein